MSDCMSPAKAPAVNRPFGASLLSNGDLCFGCGRLRVLGGPTHIPKRVGLEVGPVMMQMGSHCQAGLGSNPSSHTEIPRKTCIEVFI